MKDEMVAAWVLTGRAPVAENPSHTPSPLGPGTFLSEIHPGRRLELNLPFLFTMKFWRPWLFLSTFLTAGVIFAQDAASSAPSALPPAVPGENVVIHLQGKYAGVAIDSTFVQDIFQAGTLADASGIGGMVDNNPQFYTLNIGVRRSDDAYAVQFDIGTQIPVVQTTGRGAGNAATSTITYRSVQLHTTALLQPGQPVVIYNDGDTLTATLEKQPVPAGTESWPTLGEFGRLGANLKATLKITNSEGVAHEVSGILGGDKIELSTISSYAEIVRASVRQPVLENISLKLHPRSDGLGVELLVGNTIPTVTSRPGPAGGDPTAVVTYRPVATHVNVAIKKLGEPMTVYANGKHSIVLTVARATP